MITISILIIVYLLSILFVWNYIRISCSIGGTYENQIPPTEDVVSMFIPILNTLMVILMCKEGSPRKKLKQPKQPSSDKWKITLFQIKNDIC